MRKLRGDTSGRLKYSDESSSLDYVSKSSLGDTCVILCWMSPK